MVLLRVRLAMIGLAAVIAISACGAAPTATPMVTPTTIAPTAPTVAPLPTQTRAAPSPASAPAPTETRPAPTKSAPPPAATNTPPVLTPTSPAPTATPAVATPAWFAVALTDVNSGAQFKINDFRGKVVLVETLAVWCTTCLSQQREIVALKKKLGQQPDLVSVALAVDPNESAELLKNHASKNGFDWLYALAPAAVAREIGNLYGNQFLNPPSAPMLIIDRHGQARPLPFGVKSADKLAEALQPVLAVKP